MVTWELFTGMALSGGVLRRASLNTTGQLAERSIILLDGLHLPKAGCPLLDNHQRGRVVGICDRVWMAENRLHVWGEVRRDLVANSYRWGVPFDLSVYVQVAASVDLEYGEWAEVNGRRIEGPCLVVTGGALEEVSVVENGADLHGMGYLLNTRMDRVRKPARSSRS